MSQIQEVELSIEQAKGLIARKDQALKLTDNKDFKALVLQGYFVDEAARLALLSSDPMLDAEQRADVMQGILALGYFKRYMSGIIQFGRMAEGDLKAHTETLSELHSEGAE